MMRIRQICFFSTVILFIFPLFLSGQISVSKIDDSFNPGSNDGIIYALPRTLVRVDVTIEQKELLAGPLRNYAEEYMGITNFISENGFEYSIKDISISTVAEADPEQYYFIKLEEKTSRQDWQTIISLNGTGMITSISGAEKNVNTPSVSIDMNTGMSPDEIMEIFRNYADLNMYAKVDTIVRTINIDTITIENYTFRTTIMEKPLEVKAEETAEMIIRIREGRYNLLTGYQEVNYSEGALRFMYDELQGLEEEYLRLFTGAVVKSYFTYSFTYLPTAENIGNTLPLFRLSKNSGIVEAGGAGEPVLIRVETSGNTAGVLAVNGSSELTSNTAQHGLFYRIPEEAEIKILYHGNTAAQLRSIISQFGLVTALPASVSNVEFDGATGGLKSIKLEAE
jgi:hypothetical protein